MFVVRSDAGGNRDAITRRFSNGCKSFQSLVFDPFLQPLRLMLLLFPRMCVPAHTFPPAPLGQRDRKLRNLQHGRLFLIRSFERALSTNASFCSNYGATAALHQVASEVAPLLCRHTAALQLSPSGSPGTPRGARCLSAGVGGGSDQRWGQRAVKAEWLEDVRAAAMERSLQPAPFTL